MHLCWSRTLIQVTNSVAHVQSGTTALQTAKRLQKNSRKCMCIAIILLLIIIAVVVLAVLKPWNSGKGAWHFYHILFFESSRVCKLVLRTTVLFKYSPYGCFLLLYRGGFYVYYCVKKFAGTGYSLSNRRYFILCFFSRGVKASNISNQYLESVKTACRLTQGFFVFYK